MTVVNLVTDVTAAVVALNTIVTDCAAVIAHDTDATGAPVVNVTLPEQVAAAVDLRNQANSALQLLNRAKFQSGSHLDTNLTTG